MGKATKYKIVIHSLLVRQLKNLGFSVASYLLSVFLVLIFNKTNFHLFYLNSSTR